MTGCSSEGVGVGIVVRARLHDRHLIEIIEGDGEPLSSDCEDWSRAGCWDRERLNRRSGQRVIYRARGGPRYGDLRDWPAIALWAKDIAAQLKVQAPAEPERQSGPIVVL